ncbi:Hypothetical protein SMAX5B_006778 [Scophthalmus maximus]|uniref:Uncharacterized protein n=1 Tax=Scophthalmus maximus TaxID=52904 RepID=A0A2U9B7K5_SCOMX|nr:Hypothetical protein SMAX5B_006778 [Scophthalmus maximus]
MDRGWLDLENAAVYCGDRKKEKGMAEQAEEVRVPCRFVLSQTPGGDSTKTPGIVSSPEA